MQITAQRLASGRTEVALRQRETDGSWSERLLPRARFFPANATVGRWLSSLPLTVPPTCEQGPAVPQPDKQSDLIGDCEVLLAASTILAGTGSLDWGPYRAISTWEGITIEEGRVTRVERPSRGLAGIIPEELGALTGLQVLNLADNALTGEIPESLGYLPRLQAVNFAGNALGGRLLPWDDLLLDPGEPRRYDYIPLNDEVATKTAAAVAAARVRFDGEPSATVRDAFLKEFVSVVEFFADRYDLVFTPGVTLQVMEDSSGVGYADSAVYLSKDFVSAIAHEYVHALQDDLSGGHFPPRWLTEGVAVYFEGFYHDATGWYPRQLSFRAWLENARDSQDPLQDLEVGIRSVDGDEYAVGFLATEYLVSIAGEDALWDFHRRLATNPWRVAFEDAFGMTVRDFYEAFESHRAQLAPPLSTIRGKVLEPDGQPTEGIHVWAKPIPDGPGARLDHTRHDGSFSVAAPTETVTLWIYHPDCFSVRRYFDGESVTQSEESIYVGETNVTGLVINFPWAPGSPCPRPESS